MLTKKDRERHFLRVFLSCIGEDPDQWPILEERERPDFLLCSPQGDNIGLEVTELLKESQGELRSAERRVCKTLVDVVGEFIQVLGAHSAYINGNNKTIAPSLCKYTIPAFQARASSAGTDRNCGGSPAYASHDPTTLRHAFVS